MNFGFVPCHCTLLCFKWSSKVQVHLQALYAAHTIRNDSFPHEVSIEELLDTCKNFIETDVRSKAAIFICYMVCSACLTDWYIFVLVCWDFFSCLFSLCNTECACKHILTYSVSCLHSLTRHFSFSFLMLANNLNGSFIITHIFCDKNPLIILLKFQNRPVSRLMKG